MNKTNQTKDKNNMNTEWKDTPASTADQIERSLNQAKQNRLDTIVANCDLVLANSDNAAAKQFAKITKEIALGNR